LQVREPECTQFLTKSLMSHQLLGELFDYRGPFCSGMSMYPDIRIMKRRYQITLVPRSLVATTCIGRLLITAAALPRRCPKAGQVDTVAGFERHEVIAVAASQTFYTIAPQIL
jgi:hypothetical protein